MEKRAKQAVNVQVKLKERRSKTQHLIEAGGLVVKAKLDKLPINALYGALLSVHEEYEKNEGIMAAWVVKGDKALNAEQNASKSVVVRFEDDIDKEMRDQLRTLGLRWSRSKFEWYGTTGDLDLLKKIISDYPHIIEILDV